MAAVEAQVVLAGGMREETVHEAVKGSGVDAVAAALRAAQTKINDCLTAEIARCGQGEREVAPLFFFLFLCHSPCLRLETNTPSPSHYCLYVCLSVSM